MSREEYVCGMIAEDRRYEVEFQADVSFIVALYVDRFHSQPCKLVKLAQTRQNEGTWSNTWIDTIKRRVVTSYGQEDKFQNCFVMYGNLALGPLVYLIQSYSIQILSEDLNEIKRFTVQTIDSSIIKVNCFRPAKPLYKQDVYLMISHVEPSKLTKEHKFNTYEGKSEG